ncbi:FAD-binding and (Fe-S)-binding domain-containing protein [Anaeromyxobacter diazotrophicus]|uniref:Dimethylmenaquinone methyltransferase n=1 Tax=Anaeromyxobacter diazotrophicus TaxID=2590199 RepID=A0A7I9VSH8_9BACT|nr:FAD-binding and (Fe-S)-binding domain-containing protein [Anaeromyxobacter diazotrophicus]GEJ59039.1 dimethylmenaquinone methyltransferase [Anaeromyxobacter diazotrophicus]
MRVHREQEPARRPHVPGIGPAAEPLARLRHEEEPRGARRAFPPAAARALAADLRRHVEAEVRFDPGSRALYATDGSNYRQVPIGVVVPRSIDEVPEILAACRRHGAPVLARGGGTSLAGQCCNVAVVIDFSKYCHHILELDPVARTAWVEPGLVLDDLRRAAERHHLTFGPDPSTHNHCTLGGMIGNNSCGVHSVMAGRTADNVLELDVLTYDGTRLRVGATSEEELEEIVRAGGRRGELYAGLRGLRDRYGELVRRRFPHIPRRVSGYALDELLPENGFHVARSLVGSEGTCAIVLRAKVRLVPSPPSRTLVVLGYPSVYEAGDHIPEILRHGPIGLEGLDDRLVEDMKKKRLHPERTQILPDGRGWLLVEFGGATREEADAAGRRMMEALRGQPGAPSMKLFDDPEEEHIAWKVRESGLGATARVPGQKDTWEGWEDSAVPVDQLGAYLRQLRKLFEKHGYGCALYGHFGQGCVHTRIDFDLTSAEGVRRYRAFVTEAAHLVVAHGGSLSGEHGDGQSRAELLPIMFGDELVAAFAQLKRLWDPAWKLNPGKVVDPYRLDENLRLGPGYQELRPATFFRFREDGGSFGRAAARCVGVGECRREQGGVMCPSYMVTREERHSTRGRAHLLFEMMQGEPLRGGWRDPHVKEALDLCLACKGCKSDCPMNVDMATYKAEFLAHYWRGRLRPRHAYAMGLIMVWARLASLAPRLVNLVTHAPGLAGLAKLAGGIAGAREVPRFAPYTFRRWYEATRRARPAPAPGARRAVLFVDTFNDHFHPEAAIATLEALEGAGYQVELPSRRVCCGRPLYDFGMLDRARAQLVELLEVLTPAVEQGLPVVGIEPSCVAVLRDELLGLFPDDPRAKRLAEHTLMLSELIERDRERFPLPRLEARAVFQGHCHHHAVMGLDAELAVLKRMGLQVERPDSGCCGMAGSFGFERGEPHRVSLAAGERGILPAVRAAPEEALILADGFSCKEQIAQGTRRRGLHLAEVLKLARQGGAPGPLPERRVVGRLPALPWRARAARGAVLALVAVAVAGAALAGARGPRRR